MVLRRAAHKVLQQVRLLAITTPHTTPIRPAPNFQASPPQPHLTFSAPAHHRPPTPTLTRYAFCYVAIYGQSFTEAGKSVYSLFERHGVATLISNGTTDLILTMTAFVGGAFGMIVTGVVALAVYGTSGGAVMVIMAGGALVSCALVYSVMSTTLMTPFTPSHLLTPPYTPSQVSGGLVYFVMQTVDSCVATLFVCFVEDPAALSVTAPEAYEVLSAAWGERYPEFSKVRANGAF